MFCPSAVTPSKLQLIFRSILSVDWFTSEPATSAVTLTVGYKVVWINLDSMLLLLFCVCVCSSVRVIVNNFMEVKPIHNVIGYIKGSEEPGKAEQIISECGLVGEWCESNVACCWDLSDRLWLANHVVYIHRWDTLLGGGGGQRQLPVLSNCSESLSLGEHLLT